MAKKEDVKTETTQKPKSGFKINLRQLMVWSFLIINAVVMIGGTVVIYYAKLVYTRPTITEEKESASLSLDREIRNGNPVRYTFEPFTVNLNERPRKLVHATIQLEMLSEEGYEEAVDIVPVARDEIVKIFNSKRYEDIESIQGKLFLKDQIMTAMNKLLHKGAVKEVYFDDFVVQ